MFPAVTLIPPRPAVLVVDGREVPVPAGPVSADVTQRRSVELRPDGPDRLVLDPIPGPRWVHVVFFLVMLAAAVGLAWVAVETAAADGNWAALGFLLPPAALPGFFVVLIVWGWLTADRPWRVRLDRAAGVVAVDRAGGEGYEVEAARPLADVLAVQLVHVGYHTSETQAGDGVAPTRAAYHGYEMNLLFDGNPAARMRLCGHADWEWMRREGGRLADFLGVPVVDQLHPG